MSRFPVLLSGGLLLWTVPLAEAQWVYFTDYEPPGSAVCRLNRASTDGSTVEVVNNGLPCQIRERFAPDVAFDAAGGKVYWVENDNNEHTIRRSNLDGSNVEDIATGEDGVFDPRGIALVLPPSLPSPASGSPSWWCSSSR